MFYKAIINIEAFPMFLFSIRIRLRFVQNNEHVQIDRQIQGSDSFQEHKTE